MSNASRLAVRAAAVVTLPASLWLGAAALDHASARAEQPAGPRWYKGNTHTHTLNSDGDSSPDDVARWYREHGYNFLVLSDHNVLTGVDGLNAVLGADEQFLLIRGEEVTDRFEKKPIHVNALNVTRVVQPRGGSSVMDVLQRDVTAILEADGVPSINHPNFGWAITATDLAAVAPTRLFEIFNGHPQTNSHGPDGPGLEALWDTLLTRGARLYGIAVDDAHDFKRPWAADASRPGQGWIYVRASRLGATEILDAMMRGDFYASTGVELEDVHATPGRVSVAVRPRMFERYRIRFTGSGGRVLKDTIATAAGYDIVGAEGYVRVTIASTNGQVAWTQPAFLTRQSTSP